MPDKPAVSVVIPLFNKGPYIARALNSVLTQTFQNFEVIVVDDGSTDRGAEVVKNFKDSRICLIQQENRGESAARNRGIIASNYNLIALLDADDEWSQDHLKTLVDLSLKYPGCALFSTNCSIIKNNKKQKTKIHDIPTPPWDGIINNYFSITKKGLSLLVTSSSAAIKKDAILSVDGFPVGITQYVDEVVWGKIALRYKMAFSWDGEALYHAQKGSASDQLLPIDEHPFVFYAKKSLSEGTISPIIVRDLNEYILSLHMRVACRNIRCMNYEYTIKNLKACGWYILKPMNIYLIMVSFALIIKRNLESKN